MEMLDKGMVHIPSWVEWEGVRFRHTTQKNAQFKTCELFLYGICHLIFSGSG